MKRIFRSVVVAVFIFAMTLPATGSAWHGKPCSDSFYPYNPRTFTFIYRVMVQDCNLEFGDLRIRGTLTRENEHSIPESTPSSVSGEAYCDKGTNCEFLVTLPHPSVESGVYRVDYIVEELSEDGEFVSVGNGYFYGPCRSAAKVTQCMGYRVWLPAPVCDYTEQVILGLCEEWPLLD